MKGLTKHQAASIVSATTEDAKVKAAAEVMVERPLDLIKHILMKHEQAVIEVMREQQQQIKELVEALQTGLEYAEEKLIEYDQAYNMHPATKAGRGIITSDIATIRAALEQHGERK